MQELGVVSLGSRLEERAVFFHSFVRFLFKAFAGQKEVDGTAVEEMVLSENEAGGGPAPLCGLHRATWAGGPRCWCKDGRLLLLCALWPGGVTLQGPQMRTQTGAAGSEGSGVSWKLYWRGGT